MTSPIFTDDNNLFTNDNKCFTIDWHVKLYPTGTDDTYCCFPAVR